MEWSDPPYHLTALGIDKCCRYHEKLCCFYGRISDAISFINMVASSAAFVVLFGSKTEGIGKALVAMVAILSISEKVFKFGSKAKRHEDLRKRFLELQAKLWGVKPSPAAVARFKSDRARIEKDEPPCKRLVDLQAMNEAMRGMGYLESALIPLSTAQRRFGYFAEFDMKRLENWRAAIG